MRIFAAISYTHPSFPLPLSLHVSLAHIISLSHLALSIARSGCHMSATCAFSNTTHARFVHFYMQTQGRKPNKRTQLDEESVIRIFLAGRSRSTARDTLSNRCVCLCVCLLCVCVCVCALLCFCACVLARCVVLQRRSRICSGRALVERSHAGEEGIAIRMTCFLYTPFTQSFDMCCGVSQRFAACCSMLQNIVA